LENNWDLVGCVDDEPYPDGDADFFSFQQVMDAFSRAREIIDRLVGVGVPFFSSGDHVHQFGNHLHLAMEKAARDLEPLAAMAERLSRMDASEHGSTIEPAKTVKGRKLPTRVFNHGPKKDPFHRSARKKS
jgi:hypothetical protein